MMIIAAGVIDNNGRPCKYINISKICTAIKH